MKNQGISLISLIITIIVIIILAAIVIFTGLGTPDSANFAHFCQDVDNVQSVVLNSFADLKASYATQNKTRTNEQIYAEVASGKSGDQYTHMAYAADPTSNSGSFNPTPAVNACQNIKSGNSKINGYKLPDVRQSNTAWYVTADGRVFNATGYVYKVDGVEYTYWTANARTNTNTNKLNATNDTYSNRAKAIATVLNGSGDESNISVSVNN